MAKVATDFERIIQEGRERKKNEALAQKIFSKDRRQSAPSKLKPGAGPSLASRVGVKKQRTASLGPKALPAGNIDGDWTHDLHGTVNGGKGGAGGLASRISAPGGKPVPGAAANNRRSDRRTEQRAAKVAAAIERSGGMADVQITSSAPTGPAVKKGLSIRGLAGPFAVMAQNFAPGTTAADIESAMTPVGGEMLSCRIIKTSPLIVAEMVFATKEGGDAVIDMFNNQTADGRIIKVYPKPGGYKEPVTANGSRPANVWPASSHVIDGTNGFPEHMAEDDGTLYSDRIVNAGGGGGGGGGGGRGTRKGRGFDRGGRR